MKPQLLASLATPALALARCSSILGPARSRKLPGTFEGDAPAVRCEVLPVWTRANDGGGNQETGL